MSGAMDQIAPGLENRTCIRRVKTIKSDAILVLILLTMPLSPAGAQDTTEPMELAIDTSKWKCKFCEFEEGWYSDVTLGVGYVDEASFKFGEYNGLNEDGAYLIGEINARYRGEDAAYLDLSVADVGLDTRSLAIEGGRQGSYDLFLRYDEWPHFVSDSASTPYLGSGGDALTLPAGWVSAGSTAGMTALPQTLREVDLETRRKRLGTGISITTDSPWSYRVDLRRDDKAGSKRGGGAFLFNSAQLVEPVDYLTDEIDAAVSYARKDWQASLAYYVSTFTNSNESLTWENAFAPVVPVPAEGQLALPPDNEFQQLALSAAYQVNARNLLSADFAVGHMEQNEKLLQATLNPALLPLLPADSANAEVDTTNARLKFVSMMTDRLRFSASYSYDDRDNKTPQLMYDWVVTDIVPATQRSNLPYSYTRNSVKLKADYDYARGTRFGVGYDMDDRERTFQEVDETSEDTLWGTIRVRSIDTLFLEFRLATSSREASDSGVVTAIVSSQNALMNKYHMADRERDSIRFFASFMPHPDYTVGLSLDSAWDKYDKSELGLTESRDNSVNVDVSAMLSDTIGLSTFIGRQNIDSSQAGSQTFSSADWFANTRDSFDNFGIGITYILIENTLDIGADFSRARSTGQIDVDGVSPTQAFPDLRTDLETVRLYLNYRLDENLSLRAVYWHETYDSSDWAVDGVAPDTVPNLLSFGELSPDYSNNVVQLAMRYRF